MGIIITKFRKKKTTYEILEKLENEIQSIEEFRRSTEQTQKKMVGRFIFISVCVYCITALIFYFYFFPASAYERIIYIIPLIILPVLLIFIKRILTWYYNRKIRKNQQKLTNLKDEKKKILEDVMDKETYKVAKTILDKFAPEQIKKNTSFVTNDSTPARPGTTLAPIGLSSVAPSQTGLRYRGQFLAPSNNLALGTSMTPRSRQSFMPPPTPALIKSPQEQSIVPSAGRPAGPGTPLLLPRAILPRERSVLDKMVDYLVGDGPSNRFALICKNCSSHNGMALKEEFDYLSFRCCYCLAFNPARKKRPAAPKLNVPLAIKSKRSDISDSDRNSPSDTDSDSEGGGPIVTEPQSDSPDEGKTLSGDKITNLSDIDKLSDLEIKNSDTESSAMEVDSFVHLSEE
ncbi:lunapark, partial [Asbolus verrucosus]